MPANGWESKDYGKCNRKHRAGSNAGEPENIGLVGRSHLGGNPGRCKPHPKQGRSEPSQLLQQGSSWPPEEFGDKLPRRMMTPDPQGSGQNPAYRFSGFFFTKKKRGSFEPLFLLFLKNLLPKGRRFFDS